MTKQMRLPIKLLAKVIPFRTGLFLAPLFAGIILFSWWQTANTETEAAASTSQWTTPLRISVPVTGGGAFNPSLQVAPNGTLLTSYSSGPSGVQRLTYSFSTDQGENWSAPAVVPNSLDDSTQVHFHFDPDGQAHVVWTEGDLESIDRLVYVHRLTNNQWSPIKLVNLAPVNDVFIFRPRIFASGGGRLDVVWAQGSNQTGIFHSYSLNNGDQWSPAAQIHAPSVTASNPALTVTADGRIHVVWEEGLLEPFGNFATYYLRGTIAANGSISGWEDPVNISAAPGVEEALRPTLIERGGNLHVSFTRRDFEEGSGQNTEEQYTYYTQVAPGFTPVNLHSGQPLRVNTTDPYALISGLAVCNNKLRVFYHGIANPASQTERLWESSSQNGLSWQTASQITTGPTRAVNPQIVCYAGLLHIVYQRIQPGGEGSQIYYLREIATLYLPIIIR